MTARDRIVMALVRLGPDELDVLAEVAVRLAAGRHVYGELQLAADRRDFRAEAGEELLDAVVYLAADTLRRRGL